MCVSVFIVVLYRVYCVGKCLFPFVCCEQFELVRFCHFIFLMGVVLSHLVCVERRRRRDRMFFQYIMSDETKCVKKKTLLVNSSFVVCAVLLSFRDCDLVGFCV